MKKPTFQQREAARKQIIKHGKDGVRHCNKSLQLIAEMLRLLYGSGATLTTLFIAIWTIFYLAGEPWHATDTFFLGILGVAWVLILLEVRKTYRKRRETLEMKKYFQDSIEEYDY